MGEVVRQGRLRNDLLPDVPAAREEKVNEDEGVESVLSVVERQGHFDLHRLVVQPLRLFEPKHLLFDLGDVVVDVNPTFALGIRGGPRFGRVWIELVPRATHTGLVINAIQFCPSALTVRLGSLLPQTHPDDNSIVPEEVAATGPSREVLGELDHLWIREIAALGHSSLLLPDQWNEAHQCPGPDICMAIDVVHGLVAHEFAAEGELGILPDHAANGVLNRVYVGGVVMLDDAKAVRND
mmetsp:Transcript_65679/g.143162  ORF Transcript_65679/g.143162 Transcript_65679/m.143162 type:complete len:239 (-) Transcript_65679:336-1052(-)